MKKLLFAALALAMSANAMADDVIVLTDATEINCRIVEVGDGYIKYKRSDNPDGPTFNQSTKGVFYVKYENGEKVNYNTKQSVSIGSIINKADGNVTGGFIANDHTAKFQITPHCGVISALYGTGYKTSVPPVGVDFEYVLVPTSGHGGGFSVGLGVQYTKCKLEDSLVGFTSWGGFSSEDANIWSLIVGATGSYNYYFSPKFEAFGSILLGYEYAKAKIGDYDDDEISKYFEDIHAGGVAYNVSIGARYHITPGFNVRAQLGYGVSIIDLGLGVRF